MSEGELFVLCMVVTIFACGMWAGWGWGRHYEKGVQALKRARVKGRPNA